MPDEIQTTIECEREIRKPVLDPCPKCGATAEEACPLDESMTALLRGRRVSADQGAVCNPDDGVCESCQ